MKKSLKNVISLFTIVILIMIYTIAGLPISKAYGTEQNVGEIESACAKITDVYIDSKFYVSEISDELYNKMYGKSYKTYCPLDRKYLRYVHVLHKNLDGEILEGEIVCNVEIANDLKDIFRELYDASYPIEKIKLIDEYNASDDASIRDNNSSCFNYRTISGTNVISKHGMGLAMDINTFYNPYVTWYNGVTKVEPSNATAYVDRSKDFIYKINRNDLCYRLFIQHGFEWGGDWSHAKDYQHFELPNSRVNAIKARQGV